MCKESDQWRNTEIVWSALPERITQQAIEDLKQKCGAIIKPGIANVTIETAFENRLCKYRREWQSRQRRSNLTAASDKTLNGEFGSGSTHENDWVTLTNKTTDNGSDDASLNPMSIDSIISRDIQ